MRNCAWPGADTPGRAAPGLSASSTAYLRRQFLHTAGRVRVSPTEVRASLEPVPLAVVLQMAGMTGWQGPLPWLAGRELSVEIRA